MSVKSLKQVLETHADIVQRFAKQQKTVTRKQPAATRLVLQGKQRLLTNLESRITQVTATRDEAIARYDVEIATLETRAEGLRKEVEADRKNLGGSTEVVVKPGDTVRPKADVPVDRVKGIGRTFSTRLQANNVKTVDEFARMKPGEVARVLSVSESQADVLLAEAKKVR